ncbi:MAG: hypothetical protein IH607_02295 [Firmicutes bacterium]|nr:hypothetical protein [Bacillota bacterium]
MKKVGFRAIIGCLITLSCCAVLALPHALAAPGPAVEAYVGGVELNAATPYWRNGDPAASASVPSGGWNAYFDAATSTLKLQNIEITDLTFLQSSTTEKSCIEIYGNVTLELMGDNELRFVGNPAAGPAYAYGIFVEGSITVRGSGSLSMALQSDYDVIGMFTLYGISFYGGSITMRHQADWSMGIWANGSDVLIDGTQIDIGVSGASSIGAYVDTLTLKSGKLIVDAEADGPFAYGVLAHIVSLQGGTLDADASGAADAIGFLYEDGELEASGGQFVMSGSTAAISSGKSGEDLQAPAAGMQVFVSYARDGSGKTRWVSPADGDLAYSGGAETFRFVEFQPVAPQTDDEHTPGFWVGVALIALIVGIMLGGYTRKKR